MDYLTVAAFAGGVTLSLASLGILIWQWKAMSAKLIVLAKWISARLFTRTAFFWAVNVVFMAVSVLHAGVFFGIAGDHAGGSVQGVASYLGFAVSFFLDLVTIILMQALLESKYRGDEQRARQFLLFIVICAATSFFANLAIALNDFDATKVLPHAPEWVQIAAPYVLSSFPLFVIMMSIAAEMIINIRPMDKLDATTFEADEKKRVRLLELRNEYLGKQVDAELAMYAIRAKQRANRALHRGKAPRSFRWPWEKPLDIDQLIAGIAKQLEGAFLAAKSETVVPISEQYIGEMIAQNTSQLAHEFTQKFEGILQQFVVIQHLEIALENQRNALETQAGYLVQLSETMGGMQHDLEDRIEEQIARLETRVIASHSNAKIERNSERSTLKNEEELASQNAQAESPDTATNYGMSDDEIALLTTAYPALVSWFERLPSGVSVQEIVDATQIRPLRINNAVNKGRIKPAKGPGKRLQTGTVLRWLLRAEKQPKRATQSALSPDAESPVADQEAGSAPSSGEQFSSNGHTSITNLADLQAIA